MRSAQRILTCPPVVALAAVAAHLLASSGCGESSEIPPDVIIIVTDTTRADRLGIYGHERNTSPSIDRFAEEAIVFERAWSTASWTLPAHASLLTGKHPTAHGARMTPFTDADSNGDNPAHLREEAITLAELLKDRIYHTAAIAGAGWLAPEFGLLQGYDHRDAENHRTLPANVITDRALRWIDSVPEEESLHLLVNYFDPHWPYRVRPAYDRFSRPEDRVPIPTLAELFGGAKPSPRQFARIVDLYDSEIAFMDAHIGRLLDGLRQRGRYEDAMIVLLADHGDLLGEHDGVMGHGAWLWEEVLRIPLIVRFPDGRGGGTRSTAPVSTVDVLSWIAAETGLELPDDVDGLPMGERSLVIAEEFPNKVFASQGLERSLVTGVSWPHKLIVSSDGEHSLFDLESDPGELRKSDDEAKRNAIAARLEARRALLVAPPVERRPMSPEALEQLRELGYIE